VTEEWTATQTRRRGQGMGTVTHIVTEIDEKIAETGGHHKIDRPMNPLRCLGLIMIIQILSRVQGAVQPDMSRYDSICWQLHFCSAICFSNCTPVSLNLNFSASKPKSATDTKAHARQMQTHGSSHSPFWDNQPRRTHTWAQDDGSYAP